MYLYISGGVVGKMAGWRDVKSSIGGSTIKRRARSWPRIE